MADVAEEGVVIAACSSLLVAANVHYQWQTALRLLNR